MKYLNGGKRDVRPWTFWRLYFNRKPGCTYRHWKEIIIRHILIALSKIKHSIGKDKYIYWCVRKLHLVTNWVLFLLLFQHIITPFYSLLKKKLCYYALQFDLYYITGVWGLTRVCYRVPPWFLSSIIVTILSYLVGCFI